MLARTADSLYWMNRYMERIDIILRSVKNAYYTSYDINTDRAISWSTLLHIFSSRPEGQLKELSATPTDTFRELLIHDDINSVKELILKARENARGAQDHITKEVWEEINKLYHSIQKVDIEQIIKNGEEVNLLLSMINESLIYCGVYDNTMPRTMGWNFMNLGRFAERCTQTLNFLEEAFKNLDLDNPEITHILYWKNLLLDLNGYELFLKTYGAGNHGNNVIDMLFFNQEFNRSVAYTVSKLTKSIHNILKENDNINNRDIEKKIGKLYAKVIYADTDEVKSSNISEFINEIKKDMYELTQLIGYSYFSYY